MSLGEIITMAKKTNNSNDVLMEIRDKVIRIETHLSDMNGKVKNHDDFLRLSCPSKQIEMTEAMTKLNTQMKGVMFVSGALTIAIITHALTMMMN